MQNPPSPKTPLKKRKIRTHLNVAFWQCDHLRKDVRHMQILHLIPLACGLKTWYTLAFSYCVRDITDFTRQNLLLLTQLFPVFQLCSSMLWLQYDTYLSTPFLLCFVWISYLFICFCNPSLRCQYHSQNFISVITSPHFQSLANKLTNTIQCPLWSENILFNLLCVLDLFFRMLAVNSVSHLFVF